MIEPLRIYKSHRGIWHAEIRNNGRLQWFSLRTRDDNEARRMWDNYCAILKSHTSVHLPSLPHHKRAVVALKEMGDG